MMAALQYAVNRLRCVPRLSSSLRRSSLRQPLVASRTASSTTVDLGGIFPPIVTPFNQDETIAYDKLEQNYAKWNRVPFRGYLVQGSNGEYAYLTTDERVEMVRRSKAMIAEDRLLLVGSGCPSTKATLQLTEAMAKAGADAAVVVTPSFFKGQMTPFALEAYFTQVANESPIPIILYNVPAISGLDMTVESIIALASHKNIIGLKDSGGDVTKLAQIIAKTESIDFQVLAGSASFLLQSYVIGAVGGVCALANVLGEEVCQLHSAYREGNLELAKQLQLSLVEPNVALTRRFGVAGLKAAMDWRGMYGGPVRRPLQPLTSKEEKTLADILRLWLH